MIEIIHKKEDWDRVLSEIGKFDFYHTYGYHNVLANEGEQPLLVVYSSQDIIIAFPFVKRKINEKYYDIKSVHGYLGPVHTDLPPDFDNTDFKSEFEELLVSENIVTAFSRLNPFLNGQAKVLEALGQIETIGELIYFDQQMDDETQKSHYNKNTRRTLKKLRQTASVIEGKSPSDIDTFIEIYHNTMRRLNAKEVFYFGHDYFNELIDSEQINSKILFAVHNETKDIIAAAFVTHSGEICHLELVATNEDYFKYSPSRLLYDEARSIMKNDEIKYLVLGGGTGGREGSLMRFKSSFTQNYIDYNIWKFIAIPDIYESLQSEFQRNHESNFFQNIEYQNRY